MPFFLLITLAACSSTEKKTTQKSTQYSSQTESEFSRIESNEAQILERYRKMREQNWDRYVRPNNGSSSAAEYARTRPVYKEPPPQPKPKPDLSEEQIRNIQVEIGQRKSIFCMKQKTLNRFDNESDCTTYVEDSYSRCVQDHGENNYSLLGCLKSRLK